MRAQALIFLALSLLIASCGGGGGRPAVDHSAGPIVSLELSPTFPSVIVGETMQFTAIATHADGSRRDITSSARWSAEEPAVLTISNSGLVHTSAVGRVRVSVNTANGLDATTFVNVLGPYTHSVLYRFDGPDDGRRPTTLMRASDGSLYGSTISGGPNVCNGYQVCGTLFKVTPQGEKTTLYEFDAGLNGNWPVGRLLEGGDGNLYGVLLKGGLLGGTGTVYKITPDGFLTVLYSFRGPPDDGYTPYGGLTRGSDGSLYGVTVHGGSNECPQTRSTCGTIYKIAPDGTYTMLYEFGATSEDGAGPTGELVETNTGLFYGTTQSGGANDCGIEFNNCGTVFKMTPSGDVSIIHSFGSTPEDGIVPDTTLKLASDGNMYGTTVAGGLYDHGTFFRVTPDDSVSVLYSFGHTKSDGRAPDGPLLVGADGNFYGVTRGGGHSYLNSSNAGHGVVFMITRDGVETVLHAFDDTEGRFPAGHLVQGNDGSLIGLTLEHADHLIGGTIYKLELRPD